MQTKLDRHTAELIAHDLCVAKPASTSDRLRIWLVQGREQGPPTATAQLSAATYHLHQTATGHWALPTTEAQPTQIAAPSSDALAGIRLTDVAASAGLDFRQGSFRFGVSNETQAMIGEGLCWLDYNGDGWQDLFVVNSYSSADTAQWAAHGGLPRSALFENVHGRFRSVTAASHAGLQVQGDGCVAADLTGNGRPDLVVTTAQGVDVLWNNGNGTFTERALNAHGWYTGAAVADVNGDGRPDVFVAGYSDPNEPVPGSLAGFPTNLAGVRDLLFLNEGHGRFREVGVQAGLESASFRAGLGAQFVDVNDDGRPDLYVANDEDPNQLYVNVPWPGGAKADPAGLGFRFEDRATAEHVADPFAGMGIASLDGTLVVTNSRGETTAAFRRSGSTFANARPAFDAALGTGFAGWGASSGRFRQLRASGSRPRRRCHPRDEARRRCRAGARARASSFRVRRRARRARAATPQRPRRRGGGRGQRRPHGRRDQHDRRQARAPPSHRAGRKLDRRVSCRGSFPGAVVSVGLADGRSFTRTVQAGSSYLSSEDPRVHFGLGSAKTAVVQVRYPWGATTAQAVHADRVVRVSVPPLRTPLAPACCERVHARAAHRLDRDGLGRDGRCHASSGRHVGAGAGARPPRSRRGDVGRRAVAGRDQLRRVPAAVVARVLQFEPRLDLRDPDEAAALALSLAGHKGE